MDTEAKKLLVTGTDFLPDEISQHIKSAEITCTSDTSEESLSEKVKGFESIQIPNLGNCLTKAFSKSSFCQEV